MGSYPKLAFFASAGYDTTILRDISVAAGATTTHDLRMTRDWAALRGGAVLGAISDNTGEEFGCGADKAFDQSQATVWLSGLTRTAPGRPPQFDGPPTVVLELPQEVDVTSFLIDPKAGCGNDETSSTREYTIETSANGTDFQTAVDGRGAAGFTDANLGLLRKSACPDGHHRPRRAVHPREPAQPAPPGCRVPAADMHGHGLHRSRGAQGPRRRSQPAARRAHSA